MRGQLQKIAVFVCLKTWRLTERGTELALKYDFKSNLHGLPQRHSPD